ncbi:MAG: S-layer homology domain-containing protein, partial [Peptococcaceae bacterium]|nr:S-layer homology domain-containing protein [Peptococcaceae bacterium]
DGNITVLNAGETDITATVQETEENAESAASYKLIVAPKTLTITADSFEVTVGSTQPELTYGVEGLVDGDSLIDNPSCTTDANMGIAGTYNIIPSGANAGSNYTISYVNGTLKVIAIVQPPSGNGPSYIPSTTPKDEPKDEPKEDSHDAVMDEVIACTEDSSCPIGEYIDIPEDAWYHDGVHYCIERNIMGGYGNGIFKPNAAVSRAMISAMLWNLEGSPVVNYALQYKDVPSDAWYTEAVRWMVAEGLAGGYGNGIYAPEDELTREQLAAILQKYAQYKGYDMTKGATVNLQSYGDVQDISAWAGEAMQWICDNGIVGGMPGKNGNLVLNPTGQATRAQVATMLMTFCENMEK